MDTLANEPLDQIFRLACTDGGYTGCSLSLVSRHIRAVSRTWRFHSISLTSFTLDQVFKFVSFFLAERALTDENQSTPTIRHLFIRCPQLLNDKWTGYEEDQGLFNTYLHPLFEAIAPDLQSFTLVCGFEAFDQEAMFPPEIWSLHFPALEALALLGSFAPTAAVAASPMADHWDLPVLPALKRMQVLPGIWLPFTYLTTWVKCVPRLTHLRVSNIVPQREENDEMELVTPLRSLLGLADLSHNLQISPLLGLKEVILQARKAPEASTYDGEKALARYAAFEQLMNDLHQMRLQAKSKVYVVNPVTSLFPQYILAHAQREWLDWIDGGRGAWDCELAGGLDDPAGQKWRWSESQLHHQEAVQNSINKWNDRWDQLTYTT